MPITPWLRQPTGDGAGRNENGNTRDVTWVAAGPLTPQEALADPDFPVAFNDPFPDEQGSPLRARDIRVNATGFRVQTVTASYSRPDNGDEHEDRDPDVDMPAVLNWQTVQEGVAIDRDVAGNAIVNGSGRPILGVSQTRNYKRLTVTVFRDSYNPISALSFENTVNAGTFEGAEAGAVKCTSINPSTSYQVGSALIPIDHSFDFKPTAFWGPEPWQTWARNVSPTALASTAEGNAMRRIVTSDGQSFGDAPLDADGRPIDDNLTYFDAAGDDAPSTSPTWVAQPTPPGAAIVAAGGITFVVYQTAPASNFNALNLF